MKELYNHLVLNGKTDSWLNLANQFNILPTATNKQKSDKVRRFYNRVVLNQHDVIFNKAFNKIENAKNILNKYPSSTSIDVSKFLTKQEAINQEAFYDEIENRFRLKTPKPLFEIVKDIDGQNIPSVFSLPQVIVEDTTPTIMSEFKEFLNSKKKNKETIQPYFDGDKNNILVIGDLHIPFNHSKYLNFCISLQRKWNCGTIIFMGDILDFHASSFHRSDMALPSADYELELSKIEVERWYKAFPEATILIGNHDRMVSRKLFDSNISSHWQKSFNEVLNTPNWKFVNEYVYNNIYFCHGEGPEANKTALYKQMSTVQGHQHSKCYIDYPAQSLFAVQCPIGVNRKELAFNYAKTDTKPWQIGATVILNSTTPLIELM